MNHKTVVQHLTRGQQAFTAIFVLFSGFGFCLLASRVHVRPSVMLRERKSLARSCKIEAAVKITTRIQMQSFAGKIMFWKKSKKPLSFAVVSENDSNKIPYPYVYVEKDGTVRELHSSERKYLETPFHPADGSRPYVKKSFNALNSFGDLRGLCLRSKIPSQITIHQSPVEDPIPLLGQELHEDTIKLAKKNGFEIIEEDGKTIYRRKK